LKCFWVIESASVGTVGGMNAKFVDETASRNDRDVAYVMGAGYLQDEIARDLNMSFVKNCVGQVVGRDLGVNSAGQENDGALTAGYEVSNGCIKFGKLRKCRVNEFSKISRGADVEDIAGQHHNGGVVSVI
jgi:hypothetical protein